MNDPDCTAFLQWALPQISLRWPGFRKVRRQVCKRLKRRIHDLQLANFAAYRARLEDDPSEWEVVDRCCHITISRFFRDRGVFEALRRRVLPDIAAHAKQEGRAAQIWSAGCAAGEEPYTLKNPVGHRNREPLPRRPADHRRYGHRRKHARTCAGGMLRSDKLARIAVASHRPSLRSGRVSVLRQAAPS